MSETEKKDAMETDEAPATGEAAVPKSPSPAPAPVDPAVAARRQVLADYRRKLLEHRELEAKVRSCMHPFDACLSRPAYCPHSPPLDFRPFSHDSLC